MPVQVTPSKMDTVSLMPKVQTLGQNQSLTHTFLVSSADYGSAIETLVTAISLIKQSKVSADDRCKVLISSLQDCLHGIESKSYGSASR